jgi:hypothetical protein
VVGTFSTGSPIGDRTDGQEGFVGGRAEHQRHLKSGLSGGEVVLPDLDR